MGGFYSPSDLQSAYKLQSATAGTGLTIGIVDAYDDPNAETDLATYRSHYGLSSCTTANGCFRKVNQVGGATPPTGDVGWGQEISTDLDMASATCPNCKLLLVEANSAALPDVGAASNEAVTLGANVTSHSYGGTEDASEASLDTFYNHPGVPEAVSTGDTGYGVNYPAASPYVVAVGGTALLTAANSRGWSETAWSGGGSGCSAFETKPSWQTDSGCAHRTVADVSAVASTQTGVSAYDTYGTSGWVGFGGTSVAAPIVAGFYALSSPSFRTGGAESFYSASVPARVFDVTAGSNGNCGGTYLCTAGVGYDGPTGLGTPDGTPTVVVAAAGANETDAMTSQLMASLSGSTVTVNNTPVTVQAYNIPTQP
ncbi:MAG: peptidase S8 [Acidimicrobiia bacterium]|nr:peptidase S8 [Acidimicrobiia bacterium]